MVIAEPPVAVGLHPMAPVEQVRAPAKEMRLLCDCHDFVHRSTFEPLASEIVTRVTNSMKVRVLDTRSRRLSPVSGVYVTETTDGRQIREHEVVTGTPSPNDPTRWLCKHAMAIVRFGMAAKYGYRNLRFCATAEEANAVIERAETRHRPVRALIANGVFVVAWGSGHGR